MLKKLTRFLKSFLPRRLPIGMTSFNAWVTDIILLTGLPNNESTRKVAAMFIFQVPPSQVYLPLRTVAKQLLKAAANQVAAQVVEDRKAVLPIIAEGIQSNETTSTK